MSSVFTWDVVNEALDNELILNMIFENLNDSYNHLKVCRLVCSKWNRLSVKQMKKYDWRNRKILKLDSDEKLQNFINTFATSSNEFIFSSFSFHGDLNHVLLNNFFKTFPQKMKYLYLGHIIKNLEQLEHILKSQDTSLIELEICSHVEDFEKFSREKKKFKSKNILCLSNLIYLCLIEYSRVYDDDDDDDENDDENQNEIIEQKHSQVYIQLMSWLLSKIPTDNICPNSTPLNIFLKDCKTLAATVNSLEMYGHIKHLKMIEIASFKSRELNIINNAGVELKLLALEPSISYDDGDGDGRMFTNEIYQFLQRQINSLEVLEYETRVFKFPSVMIALKNLHLTYAADSDGDTIQIPVLYHQYFPNLEILLLRSEASQCQSSIDFESQFLSPQEPCLSLKKLSIHYHYLVPEIMRRISTIFPQIKSLTIGNYFHDYYTDIVERSLYSELWNSSFADTLEEFYLELDQRTSDDDEEYSIDNYLCPPPGRLKLDILFCYPKQEDDIPSLYDFMSLGDFKFDETKFNSILQFKNLKKLQIVCSSYQKHPFTNFSAFYIFGNMTNLQILHLDKKLRMFSPKAMDYLRSKKCHPPFSRPFVISNAITESHYEMFCSMDSYYSGFTQDIYNLLDDNKTERIFDKHNNNDNDYEDVDDIESEYESGSHYDSDDESFIGSDDIIEHKDDEELNQEHYELIDKKNSYSEDDDEDDDENNNLEGHCIGEMSDDDDDDDCIHHSNKNIEQVFGIPELIEFGDNENEFSDEYEWNENKEEEEDEDEMSDEDESDDDKDKDSYSDISESREEDSEHDEFSDSLWT